jgi:hypothetical protein
LEECSGGELRARATSVGTVPRYASLDMASMEERMISTTKGIVLKVICGLAVAGALPLVVFASTEAEPDLLVYPNVPAEFRFNPAEYEVMSAAHPQFDPDYQIGGVSLWDKLEQRVAYEVFRAPQLTGFSSSSSGHNEFVLMTNEFNVIVDGFCSYPRFLGKVYVRFYPDPPQSTAMIELGGEIIDGLIQPINPIDVRDQTPDGFYSNTRNVHIRWSGSVGIRITAYADKNNNRVLDQGNPKWSIYVEDNSVPVANTSWGAIKAMYGAE